MVDWVTHRSQERPHGLDATQIVDVRCLSGAVNRMRAGDVIWERRQEDGRFPGWTVLAWRLALEMAVAS